MLVAFRLSSRDPNGDDIISRGFFRVAEAWTPAPVRPWKFVHAGISDGSGGWCFDEKWNVGGAEIKSQVQRTSGGEGGGNCEKEEGCKECRLARTKRAGKTGKAGRGLILARAPGANVWGRRGRSQEGLTEAYKADPRHPRRKKAASFFICTRADGNLPPLRSFSMSAYPEADQGQ